MQKQKVVVVMPAYNAAKTIVKTYKDIPKKYVDEVLVVDDYSNDLTVKVARSLKLKTFIHDKNLGYGGNQKTCYRKAITRKADIVIMLHPDYQYDAKLIPYLIKPIQDGLFDVMLGSRIRSRREAIEGGMPRYKYFFNRFLTVIENIILGLNLSEYHTGYRAFSARVLKDMPLHRFSNDFVFDAQILIYAHFKGYKIGEIQVPVRYFPEASSINFTRSLKYGFGIIANLFDYIMNKFAVNRGIFA